MYLDAYVGDLESPNFKWDGGDPSGNCPATLTSYFPESRRAYYFLMNRFEDNFYKEAKQTDWGCDVAKVTKAEIMEFMRAVYGNKLDHPELFVIEDDQKRMRDVLRQIARLDDHKLYGLCARET